MADLIVNRHNTLSGNWNQSHDAQTNQPLSSTPAGLWRELTDSITEDLPLLFMKKDSVPPSILRRARVPGGAESFSAAIGDSLSILSLRRENSREVDKKILSIALPAAGGSIAAGLLITGAGLTAGPALAVGVGTALLAQQIAPPVIDFLQSAAERAGSWLRSYF